MFKQLLNALELSFELEPDGPVLIKASDSNDPVRPDMEFVRTRHPENGVETIYLPGSSLKGAFRSHCEKLARTVQPTLSDSNHTQWLACNPLANGANEACGKHFEDKAKKDKKWRSDPAVSAIIYRESCFVCRIFGNTSLASHLHLSDAHPRADEVLDNQFEKYTEQRNGVAIDRLFGSVAVGPFQFEAAVGGHFQGRLTVRNFTIAQLGLLAFMLRDLEQQRLSIGFGKSRGLGRVKLSNQKVVIRYPAASLNHSDQFQLGQLQGPKHHIYGLGALMANEELGKNYLLPAADEDTLTGSFSQGLSGGRFDSVGTVSDDPLDGVALTIEDAQQVQAFWREAAGRWKAFAQRVAGR